MKVVIGWVASLLFLTNAVMATRLTVGGVRLSEMHPKIEYHLTLQIDADLHGERAVIRSYLPPLAPTQTVSSERVESTRLSYQLVDQGANRIAVWQGDGLEGHEVALYEASVHVQPRVFRLPPRAPISEVHPPEVLRHLEPTEAIQSDAPEIRAVLDARLPANWRDDVAATLRVLFDFVQDEIRASDYENTLDALTTLRWGEAFCGGKSRLLAAVLRAAGIPARMVGGLILGGGSKQTTHVWVEAWVNETWVPLDPLNRRFAEHPDDYLVLYYGDEVLFSHTPNINFRYVFEVKKWRVPPDESLADGGGHFLNAYRFWESFRKAQISLNLLRIILLLPVGVLMVIFCRNLVGMTTFGTFHPALMAVAFRDTGLLWGTALYVAVLGLGMLLRAALDRVQLLHTPRLGIVLIFVVAFMVAISYLGVQANVLEPARISMFPIAILTITVESFFTRSIEIGRRQAIFVMIQTLFVITIVYVILDSHLVQALVFTFPELLLATAAAYLVMGRWVGLRLTELSRFRWLLIR